MQYINKETKMTKTDEIELLQDIHHELKLIRIILEA